MWFRTVSGWVFLKTVTTIQGFHIPKLKNDEKSN